MSESKKDRTELPVVKSASPGRESGEGTSDRQSGMNRRSALKVIAAAAASPAVFSACDGADAPADPARVASPRGNTLAAGNAWDPDLVNPVVPWELTLTEEERTTLAALCDMIIPADDRSPSASELGCHDFIDEWVSAPYEGMERDKVLVRGGVIWLNRESNERFGSPFAELTDAQRTEICDDICYLPDAAPEHQSAARFFDKVRDLTASAFYTTKEGMDDIGYVGNIPLAEWPPPPDEALRHVGLEP